jgi:hypothetical protein
MTRFNHARALIPSYLSRIALSLEINHQQDSTNATASFRIRTDHSVFKGSAKGMRGNFIKKLREANKQVAGYLDSGYLDLDLLQHPGERTSLARAFAVNPKCNHKKKVK